MSNLDISHFETSLNKILYTDKRTFIRTKDLSQQLPQDI